MEELGWERLAWANSPYGQRTDPSGALGVAVEREVAQIAQGKNSENLKLTWDP